MHIETLLKDVHKEDRVLVRNVMATIETLRPYKFIHQYSLRNTKKGYDVIGQLSVSEKGAENGGSSNQNGSAATNTNDVIISVQDLDLIMNVNPTRIATCVVQIPTGNAPPQLVVRLLRADQAIVFNDVQITHIKKKTRWW